MNLARLLFGSLIMGSLFILTACAEDSARGTATEGFGVNQKGQRNSFRMPELHKIQSHVFTKNYSCGGNYQTSALFLSEYSLKQNSPELLLSSSCGGGTSTVTATTAGDDFALISDLGDVSLEEVSADRAFNWKRQVGQDNIFKQTQVVLQGQTYAVLIAKSTIRALYVFRVEQLIPDGPMAIRYAVKSYSIQTSVSRSSGFDWEKGTVE